MTSSTATPYHRDPAELQRRRPKTRPSRLKRQQVIAAWILVLPFVVVFAAMFIIPLLYALGLSLFHSSLVDGNTFAWFYNYGRALTDPSFWHGMTHVALFLVIQVPLMIGIALIFALVIDSGRLAGAGFVRLAIFLPFAVPGVVAALMWGYMYEPQFGLISQLAKVLLLPQPNLLSPQNILGSIMNIVFWGAIGYNMIVMYSALKSVPEELYDAAQIDGAGRIRVAWSIKIPAIRGAILLTVIFSVIGAFQLFNEPNLLANLAPNSVGTDFSPNLYAYNVAFKNQDVNYSAAISFLLGIAVMIISYVMQRVTNRKEKTS